LKKASTADTREEGKGADMGHTLILAVYFPLIIGGMVLVIMWGMSSAGSRHTDLPRGR
jgi:hypothetical protein